MNRTRTSAGVEDDLSSAQLSEIVDLIVAGEPRLGPVRMVTIDGPSGSGKSTFATKLHSVLVARQLRTAVVPTDHFATWEQPFSWWDQLELGVLGPLGSAMTGRYIANDWTTGEPRAVIEVQLEVPEVLIVEGVSAGRRALRGRTTYAIWVEHPDRAERVERAVARDGPQVRAHLADWQLAEDSWFRADDSRTSADQVIWVR